MSAGHLARRPELPLRCPPGLVHRAGHARPALLIRFNDATLAPARVGLTRDEVMTASEVADLLHLPFPAENRPYDRPASRIS
jgi:hypothetical protein